MGDILLLVGCLLPSGKFLRVQVFLDHANRS
jgi:hypothetical protein